METTTITAFLAIGTVIFIGFFGNVIFNRFRVPDVLLLVLLGMLIGPDILGQRFGLVTDSVLADINLFRDLFLSAALVIILFDGGLCLDLRSVIESMRLSASITVINFVLGTLVVGVVANLFLGIPLLIAFALGAIVGGTSGAIVIPIVSKMRLKPHTKAVMIMESAVTDVLVIVTTITILSVVEIGDFSWTGLFQDLAIEFTVGAVVGFVAGIAWLFVLTRLENQPLSYMITVAALFLVAGAVEIMQSSGAVAALAFGLAIGNRQFLKRRMTSVGLKLDVDKNIQRFNLEITFFVRTFFFVYLGLMFSFDKFTLSHLLAGIGLIVVIAAVRRLTTHVAHRVGDLGKDDADALFGMMPRGLAAAVLATLPATQLAGIPVWDNEPGLGDLFLNVTLVVIVGTTIVATVASFLIERRIDTGNRLTFRRQLQEGEGLS